MHLNKILIFAFGLLICGCQPGSTTTQIPTDSIEYSHFSAAVQDSFYIHTQLPLEYKDSSMKHYPVVVLLDANFHFPMLAASVHQYEKGGLLPPLILVGIGYKNLQAMDSLRVRDYLFPAALPSDEMKTPGGGERFRQFISQELLPSVDSTWRTTTHNRSLLGHSFGGYFTLYSLLKQANGKTREFKNFVAASPSVWYHAYYLNQLPAQLASINEKDSVKLFLSVGGQENPTWDVKPVEALTKAVKKTKTIRVKGGVFSQLEHMDTGQLSFLKGLQDFYH